jgi:endoglucanase
MIRRVAFVFASIILVVVGLTAGSAPHGASVAAERPRRGISVAGGEFGTERADFSNRHPGVHGIDYRYNGPATFARLAEQGLHLFRIPLRWERLQPTLGGPLDTRELSHLRASVRRAQNAGGEVIIDIHNFGRYVVEIAGLPYECAIGESVDGTIPVTAEHFADLWRRLAREFRAEPGIYAYGLMNEPHDQLEWRQTSQKAVTAIRAEGDRTRILVPGAGWSHTDTFEQCNGPKAWIDDPANNILYEAHCYLDRDGSGKYRDSLSAELKADATLYDRPAQRLDPFIQWCTANQVRGFIGEFGVPTDDARWLPLVEQAVELMDRAGMGGCYWAAGEWWGNHPLSVQPSNARALAAPLSIWTR